LVAGDAVSVADDVGVVEHRTEFTILPWAVGVGSSVLVSPNRIRRGPVLVLRVCRSGFICGI